MRAVFAYVGVVFVAAGGYIGYQAATFLFAAYAAMGH